MQLVSQECLSVALTRLQASTLSRKSLKLWQFLVAPTDGIGIQSERVLGDNPCVSHNVVELVAQWGCAVKSEELLVMDFTSVPQLNGWTEMSDVLKQVGKSKATLVLHKTRRFQRGVLFTMLNPQPDGAGFAGFRTDTQLNLSDYGSLQLLCRGQGDYYGYKVVLRHNGQLSPSYEHMFQAPIRKFETVVLPLSHFEPYFRGRKRDNSPPLDTSNITSLALLMYGGGFLPVKQSGTSSLEIDWIKAV